MIWIRDYPPTVDNAPAGNTTLVTRFDIGLQTEQDIL